MLCSPCRRGACSGPAGEGARGLRQAVEAYNDGVGSFQSRVLVQARRFEEPSATGEARQIGEPAPVEQTVRRVDTPELPLATGDD